MVKYACDKCGKEIGIESPRYIIRMQDANHKGRMDRVVCLCHPCKGCVRYEHHRAWISW